MIKRFVAVPPWVAFARIGVLAMRIPVGGISKVILGLWAIAIAIHIIFADV
jgi:hypothetical protein